MGPPGQPSDMAAFLKSLQQRLRMQEAAEAAAAAADASDEVVPGDDSTSALGVAAPLRVAYREVTYNNGDTYKGNMLGDYRHGTGIHTTSTGDVYDGGWQYDLRCGRGNFRLSNGTIYEGDWRDDKACGTGRCVYPDGSCYDGDWQDDERHGWGSLATADGQHYEGEWQHNKMHGEGHWHFADGQSFFSGRWAGGLKQHGQLVLFDASSKQQTVSYTGGFKQDVFHGEGVLEESLWLFRGSFRGGERWGQGRCSWRDGSSYEGQWRAGKRHGQGVWRGADGSVYEGDWRGDCMHGTGKLRHASGERYMGSWQHGKKHGAGKWSAPVAVRSSSSSSSSSSEWQASSEGRESYVGQFEDGQRSGQGAAVFADGGRYRGSWKANRRHGQGLMVFSDGTAFRGRWEEDEWVQSAAEPALCRLSGPGLSRAAAGQLATFAIRARDELNNPRLNGGDEFSVLLLPRSTRSSVGQQALLPTAAAAAANADVAAAGSLQDLNADDDDDRVDGAAAPPRTVAAVAAGEVQDNGDGTYSCSYCYDTAGLYELHVTNAEGEHVADSPYPIKLLPGLPSPRHCSVSGQGRHAAVAGAASMFVVTVRDAHGNEYAQPPAPAQLLPAAAADDGSSGSGAAGGSGRELLSAQQLWDLMPVEARLLGSNTLPAASVEVVPEPGGRYCCSYTAPAAPGLYVLELLTTPAGRHLGGSPFSVRVHGSQPDNTTSDSSSRSSAAADKLRWWAEVARGAFQAVDGCLEGFDDDPAGGDADAGQLGGLSGPEARLVQDNPQLPVVERMEDLWLLSKLQQERKAKEQQAQARKVVRGGTVGSSGTGKSLDSSSGGGGSSGNGSGKEQRVVASVSDTAGSGLAAPPVAAAASAQAAAAEVGGASNAAAAAAARWGDGADGLVQIVGLPHAATKGAKSQIGVAAAAITDPLYDLD